MAYLVCCEGIPLQVNYLIDESVDYGKGSNSVVSYIHDFLSTCPINAKHLDIHADNCVGQNKNNTMLQVFKTLSVTSVSVFIDIVVSIVLSLESYSWP